MQQQSAAAATNPAPQHWTSTSKCGYSFPSPCVDCTTAAECPEPSCPTSDELTPLCTDQCVVVACSDPEHIPSPLPRCGDLSYDNTPPCVDCDGIQNLVSWTDAINLIEYILLTALPSFSVVTAYTLVMLTSLDRHASHSSRTAHEAEANITGILR